MKDLNVWEERQGPEVPLTAPFQDPLPRRGAVVGALGVMVLLVGGGLAAILATGAASAGSPQKPHVAVAPKTPASSVSTTPSRAGTDLPAVPAAQTQPVVYVTRNVVEQVYVPDHQNVYLPGPTVTVPPPNPVTVTSTALPPTPTRTQTSTPKPTPTAPTTIPTPVPTTPPTTSSSSSPSEAVTQNVPVGSDSSPSPTASSSR